MEAEKKEKSQFSAQKAGVSGLLKQKEEAAKVGTGHACIILLILIIILFRKGTKSLTQRFKIWMP